MLEVVVVDLNAKDDEAARSSDEVGDEQRPQHIGFVQQALQHEAHTADTHHQEGGQGDAVGLACANGMDGLGQIAQNHRDAGYPAANLIERSLFHSLKDNLVLW